MGRDVRLLASDDHPGSRRGAAAAPTSGATGQPEYGLAVCGGGPAGTGPIIAAARDGRLDELLDLGVILIERNKPGSGKLGDYQITANSLGMAFLEGVDGIRQGPLSWLAGCREAERLRTYAMRHPPLSVVAPFLDRVGEAVAGLLSEHPRCRVVTEATVEEIRCLPADVVAVHATASPDASALTFTATRALIAMGGRPHYDPTGLDAVLGSARHKTAHADHFIDRTRPIPRSLLRSIEECGRVVIVGSSHSAWSVALLLHLGGIDGGASTAASPDISMLAKSPIRLFYGSAEEALADGYSFEAEDICPLSGRVNRYGGLRGPARDLARATLGLADTPSPVRIASLAGTDPSRIEDEVERAGAVVMATGHRAHLPTLRRADGSEVTPVHADGGTVVNDLGHLVGSDGTAYPAFIVYGLGAGLRSSTAIGGEPSFHRRATGVWLYQNHLGSAVVGDVLATAGPRADSACR